MSKIEDRNTAIDAAVGASKSRKKSLRLEKQTIRTLTGAELKLVGGGVCVPSLVTHIKL